MSYRPLTLSTHESTWTARFCWVLGAVTLFRIVHLFTAVDFQLSGDETYYWDWGRRLDWCYYSKPPLIGWLMRLVGWLSHDRWWAVRLASIALGTGALALLFALGRVMYDSRTGFFAMLLLLLTPANAMANFAFTIDSPLLLCWTGALLLFWLVLNHPRSILGWLLLTLVIGIGTLAKQMMLAFNGSMLVLALASRPHRWLLRSPAFWLCQAGSLAFLTPVIWWNEHHGWVTVAHTSEHFNHKHLTLLETFGQFLTFPALQAGVYTPLTFGLVVMALVGAVQTWYGLDAQRRVLVVFSLPGLLVFLLLAMRQAINPNWPAVFYVSAFVLAADTGLRSVPARRWLRQGLYMGGAIVALLYLWIPAISWFGWTGSKRLDPFAPLRGWEEAAAKVAAFMPQIPHPEHTFVLVLDHRYYASEMAFHLPWHPFVYRWNRFGRIESQYEVWPGPADKIGWDALVVFPDSDENPDTKSDLPRAVHHSFDKVHKLGDVEVPVGHGVRRSFQVFHCKRLQRVPPPESADPGAPPPNRARKS